MAMDSIAGSGKTSLVQGGGEIIGKNDPTQRTHMTALNRHIADESLGGVRLSESGNTASMLVGLAVLIQ